MFTARISLRFFNLITNKLAKVVIEKRKIISQIFLKAQTLKLNILFLICQKEIFKINFFVFFCKLIFLV